MTRKGKRSSRKGLTYTQIYGEEGAKEIRQKVSASSKGRKVKESTRKKLSKIRKAWWKTKTPKERSTYLKKVVASRGDTSGKNNPNYGKRHPGINKGPRPDMRGQKNPMFNKKHRNKVGVGFRPDLGHKVRSAWEANFARIIKFKGMTYEYEETSFDLENGYSYTPDFRVIEEDCFYEIKGYMNQKDENKIAKFRELYPEIKLKMIEEKEYKNLKDEYRDKVSLWEERGYRVLKQDFEFVPVGIKSIEISSSSACGSRKKLYNLTVEDDESFIAEGVVNHNTGLYDLRGSPHYIYPKTAKFLVFRGKSGNLVFAKRIRGQKPRLYMNRAIQQLDWATEEAWNSMSSKGSIKVGADNV